MIVFSNLAKPDAVEDARRAGATLVLSKFNTSPKKVLESVETLLAASDSTIAAEILPTDVATRSSLVPQVARGKILLVEDHADMSTLLAFLLTRAGHHVTSVKSHGAALQQVGEQSFDLFVLGPGFPNQTELSLCQQLRQSRPDKPILIYSTAALFSEQQEGLKAGATAFLAKPEDLFNVGQIASDLIRNRVRLAPSHIRAA